MPDRPTFHRVLVAVDGSRHSDLALAMAIALSERDHARLTILTVIPNVNESAALAYGAGVDPVALQHDADRGAERTMRAALDAVPDDQPVDSVQRRGHAGPEIVAQVRRATTTRSSSARAGWAGSARCSARSASTSCTTRASRSSSGPWPED